MCLKLILRPLILSGFINFNLGHYNKEKHHPKMGLSITDMKDFGKKYFDQNNNLYSLTDPSFQEEIKKFLASFGLDKMPGMPEYLYSLLNDHLSGYDFSQFSEDQWAYVGGPIYFSFFQKISERFLMPYVHQLSSVAFEWRGAILHWYWLFYLLSFAFVFYGDKS